VSPGAVLRLRAVLLAVAALLVTACAAGGPDAAPRSSATLAGSDGPAASGGPPADRLAPRERFFSADSPWNTLASNRAVHPLSAGLLAQAATTAARGVDGRVRRVPVTSGLVVATRVRTVPVVSGRVRRVPVTSGLVVATRVRTVPVVSGGVPTLLTCRRVACGDGSGQELLDIPADVDPDSRYDGWLTVVDEAAQQAWDFWRARREDDGSISYQLVRQWDLDGPGFQQPYLSGVRGSGLPAFAGLVRADELERGEVDHALALALPGVAAGSFVQPASTTDGTGPVTSLPAGARLFLRPDVELEPLDATPAQVRQATTLVETLRTYGAIVVGRAPVPTLYVEQATGTGTEVLLRGDELRGIGLADFRVVDFAPDDRYPVPAAGDVS
jgi:hypothetical protein